MSRAANRGPEPGDQLIRALAPVDQEIRGLCERIGLQVDLLDGLAKSSASLPLPWSATSRERAREASGILKKAPPPNLSASAVESHLSNTVDPTDTTFHGIIGAVMAVENPNWSGPAKSAFTFSLSTAHVTAMEQAIIFARSEADTSLFCEAAIAWVLYDALGAAALSCCNLSSTATQVVSALQDYSLRFIGATYHLHLQEGTLLENHPWSKLEDIVLALTHHCPNIGPQVKRMMPVLRSALNDEPQGADVMLASELEAILAPSSPDLSDGALDGEEIGTIAREYQKNVETNLAMAKHFIPLVDEDEWSKPLASLAELADSALVQTTFLTQSFWTSATVLEVMRSTISHMHTKPHIVISTTDIGLVSGDSSSVVEIVDGIRTYLRTGQRSHAELGTVAPAQRESLRSFVDFLDQMRDLIGAERIHVVVGNGVGDYLRTHPVTGFLFASGEHELPPHNTVTFDLSGRSEINHDNLARIRERLKIFERDMPFMAAVEIDLLAKELVRFLASTRGGGDALGLVGFKPTTALRLANDGLLSEPLSFTPPQLPPTLRVTLLREPEGDRQGDPTEWTSTNTPLRPIGGLRS